jgi:hypothetical protein
MIGYQKLTVASDDPQVQEYATKLLNGLVQKLDIARATAILFVALKGAFFVVLHAENPMPETNVDSMRKVVGSLSELIDEHEHCGRRVEATGTDSVH